MGSFPVRGARAQDTAAGLQLDGPLTTKTVAGPAWAKNQPIYEVNLDAYRFPKGAALREYEKHLPVLQDMGIGLVWFMPLHPRGYRKGFGSPYSVRDYREINPDLGMKADFARLVQRAHALGLRVLMDGGNDRVYAFTRQRGRDRLLLVVNLSDQPQTVTAARDAALAGTYRDVFEDRDIRLDAWILEPWAYRLCVTA